MSSLVPVIHIVDDDDAFRKAVARLLRAAGYSVALYESGDQFLENPPVAQPGCILLDVRMSGLTGPELQLRLAELQSILPIVFLTGHGDIATSVQAMKAGAEDFLCKPVVKETLFAAVKRALARYERVRERHDRRDGLRACVARLTLREKEVFTRMIRGKLNKQIAYELGVSERTVKAHRHTVMQKLNVRTLAEAVSIAEHIEFLDSAELR